MAFNFATDLKHDERTSHIPVILLTAKATVESKLEGLQTGADDYLTKPFYPFELQMRVKNLVEQRRKATRNLQSPADRVRETGRKQRRQRAVCWSPKPLRSARPMRNFCNGPWSWSSSILGNSDFNVEMFGREMGLSRVQLHRKLKALTEQAPGDFIRVFRLEAGGLFAGTKMGQCGRSRV